MTELFGWGFIRKNQGPEPPSFSPREYDDGASTVTAAGAFGTYLDLDGTIRTEGELVTRYRQMTEQHECGEAIEEIISEMIASDWPVKIVLDDVKQNDPVKKAISQCFDEIVDLLDFRHHGHDIARRWYVDGRLYFHVIIDDKNTKEGIQELRYIDPRKIRKIREVVKKQVRGSAVVAGDAVLTQTKNEYYLYSDKGFFVGNKTLSYTPPSQAAAGIRIAKDTILHVTSGIVDAWGSMVFSYLHQAIKPLNQLRTLEDASIIYRLTRAPERRIWYIDIGNLPKMKAEQYVNDIMTKHKNKLNYDAATGEVRNDRKFITMLEDYWLPQRDGKGTKVDVLPPGAAFNQIDDILFFQKRLYQSLKVPINRLNPDEQYAGGDDTATQITRDEVKFGKFVERLRTRFGMLFTKALEKQCVLKNVMTIEDFQKIAPYLKYDFVRDNFFKEFQEGKILGSRVETAIGMGPLVGRYYSNLWVRMNVLRQNETEIEEIDKQIAEEKDNPQYAQPIGMEDEQQMDDPDNPAVIADQNAVQAPPNQSKPKDGKVTNGTSNGVKSGGGVKTRKGQPRSPKQSSAKNFKTVASLLAKGT